VGSLAVAPGTTDAFAYWVGGVSGIVVAAIYFTRVEAISRVDNAALENGRVAGPVLEEVASGQAPRPAVRLAAALADATLRDELLAPGFLTPPLAERVRAPGRRRAHRLSFRATGGRYAGGDGPQTARRRAGRPRRRRRGHAPAASVGRGTPRAAGPCTFGAAIATTPLSAGPPPNAAP
jgi:hypothetical protein